MSLSLELQARENRKDSPEQNVGGGLGLQHFKPCIFFFSNSSSDRARLSSERSSLGLRAGSAELWVEASLGSGHRFSEGAEVPSDQTGCAHYCGAQTLNTSTRSRLVSHSSWQLLATGFVFFSLFLSFFSFFFFFLRGEKE